MRNKKYVIAGSIIATIALGSVVVLKSNFIHAPQRALSSEQLEMFSATSKKNYDRQNELRLDRAKADGTPGSMMFVEMKDQGYFGMCFAETAAQMIDAYRFSVLADKNHMTKASVMGLAISGQVLNSRTPLFGGKAVEMIDHVRSMGYQSEMQISKCAIKITDVKEVTTLMKIYDVYNAKLSKKIKELKDSGVVSVGTNVSYQDLHSQENLRVSKIITQYLGSKGKPFYAIPPVDVISELLDSNEFTYYWGIMNYACVQSVPRIKIKLPRVYTKEVYTESFDDFMKFIKLKFKDETSLPVGISYCSSILRDGNSFQGKDMKQFGRCLADKNGRPGGSHASVLIGVRKNPKNGETDLLVRNSWGKTCVSESKKLTLPLEIRQKFQSKWFPPADGSEGKPMYSSDWECDEGNIWINAKKLFSGIKEVQYFK